MRTPSSVKWRRKVCRLTRPMSNTSFLKRCAITSPISESLVSLETSNHVSNRVWSAKNKVVIRKWVQIKGANQCQITIFHFTHPDITEAEIAEVADTLRSGWITTGPKTKELERRLSQYTQTPKTVCLNSATAALELIFARLGSGTWWWSHRSSHDLYSFM